MNAREQISAAGVSKRTLRGTRLAVVFCLSFIVQGSSFASGYNLDTIYQNYWFNPSPVGGAYSNYFGEWPTPALTNASTACFLGSVYDNTTNAVLPVGGSYGLAWCAFGQAAEGLKSDVALGDPIPPPPGANTNVPPANFVAVRVGNNPAAYYECQDPVGAAFWVPSTKQVIAAQPGDVTIAWVMTNHTTNVTAMSVGAVPSTRPGRIFWTESPYDGPTINLAGLFPVIHYNASVPAPVYEVTTNVIGGFTNVISNVVAGVWIDGMKQMHAKNVTGMFVLEFYTSGGYNNQVQPDGIEVVEVLEPVIQVIPAEIGSRLLPVDSFWSRVQGSDGLIPDVRVGLNDTAYVNAMNGPKYRWVFSIKRTVDEPWSLEIYWKHRGAMGVLWPYEVDWYSCEWPLHPQRLVFGTSTQDTPAVLFPAGLTATLMPYMDPPLQAKISTSGRSLTALGEGRCLMKYTTTDDIWFEPIHTISHTNRAYFDLDPVDWEIGKELRPTVPEYAHAMAFDGTNDYVSIGTSWLNARSDWTVTLWFNPGATPSGALYTEGGKGGVTFSVALLPNRAIQVATWNKSLWNWSVFVTPSNTVSTNRWQYLAVTLQGGDDAGGGVAKVYLDDRLVASAGGMRRENFDGAGWAAIGANIGPNYTVNSHYAGRLDEVRIWDRALSLEEIQRNQFAMDAEPDAALLADYGFDEGMGQVIFNNTGQYHGTAVNAPTWCKGQLMGYEGFDTSWPGFIHTPEGNRYNVNRYNYPTEANTNVQSYVFAVNTNILEVWWANKSRQDGMPPVYYPSHVIRYNNIWPTNAPQIVIASGLGSSGAHLEPTTNALFFNGTSDYVIISNSPSFNVEGALTIEAWVRTDSPNDQKIVAKVNHDTSWHGYVLGIVNGRCSPELWDTDGNHFICWAGSVPTGVWTHVAFTYATGQHFTAYVNGEPVHQTAAGAPIRISTSDVYIGRASWANEYYVKGRIGEVRIWNIARSAADIRSGMYVQLDGSEPGLVAYYPFEKGELDNQLYDFCANELDGEIHGAQWVTGGRPIPRAMSYTFGSPSIYYQNDPAQPGYNPNEEHALILGGVVYALRNDLNKDQYSRPFVLVDYQDPASGRPATKVFEVVATNELYSFKRSLEAGLPIIPPMPLAAMPFCANTYSQTQPPAWRDRKLTWWARSAGDDGGTRDAVMHFYYQMQPTFYFPARPAEYQPAVGTELPWLPNPSYAGGTYGTPVPVTYEISWPANVPELKIGQTLTKPTHGLPDIWDQLSVEIIYQQSRQTNAGDSVVLFDPVVAQGTDLSGDVVQAMIESGLAKRELTSSKVRFPTLPPSLYQRLYYDPDRGRSGQLVLEGQYITPLTGDGYLLLNLLQPFEQKQARDAAAGLESSKRSAWITAVNRLPTSITPIQANRPFVHGALYAGLGRGVGYVTLAFNNSTNPQQVPPALPVSLSIIKVVPELYNGMIQVIEPENPLDEQLSLRASPDFAGRVQDYEFQWRWEEPDGGLIPNTNFPSWYVYGADIMPGTNEVTISGASPFTLADHYFAMRYRRRDPNGPTGTNWSHWTYQFAPGWVQRVMNGINPFEQIMKDRIANAVDARATMISLAGPPYEGDIALNLQAASEAGLIQVYRTVLNRAENFSIRAGVSDTANNTALLLAAGKLCDLYMLLGNEAYADAQDPTIAFPGALDESDHGADATSIFCFMNQVPNLLEEELALLRGRDDTLQPQVTIGPVYNRLIWNFTKGINGGEAAYAYNYNIRGTPTNTIGTITAEDAKRLYPQGHGDAWGHYLSALSGYYELLSNTNFVWQTKPTATLMGNATVSSDFFDEQKFAEAAAAKARTGVEIISRTYRKVYSEEPTTRWSGYHDSNTNRAWGLDGWASRAGQGALYDWAVANSLLLDELTNMIQVGGADRPPEGIQKIDRTTVPELAEIADALVQVQQQIDNADVRLNPLGLARDVVPFDISPTEIDAGKTHFEQIYERAVQALRNSCVAFDHARGISVRMREQWDSAADLAEQLAQNEAEYHNRLIGIFGYPYPDDIGPGGTYPQGYEGPDLVNWRIVDLENLVVNPPKGQPITLKLYNYVFDPGNDFSGEQYDDYTTLPTTYHLESNVVGTITVYIDDSGLQVKPPTWTGRRPALGELQIALSEVIQSWYALQAKVAEYNQMMYGLEVELLHRQADYYSIPTKWWAVNLNTRRKKDTSEILEGLKLTKSMFDLLTKGLVEGAERLYKATPHEIVGLTGPFPVVQTKLNMGGVLGISMTIAATLNEVAAHVFEEAIIGREGLQERWDLEREAILDDLNYKDLLRWPTLETQVKLKEQFIKQAELMKEVQALGQQVQQVKKLLAEGQRLLTERAQVRARAAQRLQMNRYQDLSFRIFRDDALRRYKDTFDLAARYVYLAAKAYDYETGLLSSDTRLTPGSRFFEQIVRARVPGRFDVWLGEPQVGGDLGEAGLADILARMKANWDVVKGRFGFNNPDTETSRFSLRQELFRISPLPSSDRVWAQVLENCKVDDLRKLPEFRRYCIPFSDSTNAEPALVIPFSTFVVAGKNYFGHDLAGGDNAYDPTHQATKIRSVGIWFTGYNTTFNTNTTGGGLANAPRVYLIPTGVDVMRSPTRAGVETRSWKILDQAIPLPYNLGGMDIDNPDYLPITDSLTEPLCQIRRFASLRAYHDSGQFNEAETCNNARLIGRSVWNTRWLLIIPGRTLLADPEEGIERFIHGAIVNGYRDGNGVKDIKIFFQTYSIAGE